MTTCITSPPYPTIQTARHTSHLVDHDFRFCSHLPCFRNILVGGPFLLSNFELLFKFLDSIRDALTKIWEDSFGLFDRGLLLAMR
jgi:hypothetical protein